MQRAERDRCRTRQSGDRRRLPAGTQSSNNEPFDLLVSNFRLPPTKLMKKSRRIFRDVGFVIVFCVGFFGLIGVANFLQNAPEQQTSSEFSEYRPWRG